MNETQNVRFKLVDLLILIISDFIENDKYKMS